MFENILKDQVWQHQHSDTAKVINRMHGKVWIPEDPVFKPETPDAKPWRPPGYKPTRGRSPVHTRFTRTPETVKKDRQAWHLRELRYSYQEIADAMGYASRQAAHKAVQRAERDRITRQSRVDKVPLPATILSLPRSTRGYRASDPLKLGRARGRDFPPVRP